MKSYFSLIKVFQKATKMDPPKEKSTKIKIIVLSIFAIFCIMLPVTVGCGILVNLATATLEQAGHAELGVLLMYSFISIFTIVFGMNVIFNELYFSNDIEYLLPLPLRPWEITGAKFTAAYKAENFMQFLLVFACIIGFGTAHHMNILQWIIAFIGGLLLPIVPMAYCAILGIILMSFTKFIKGKDTIRRISVIFMVIVLLAMTMTLTQIQDADIEAYILNVASGDLLFIKIIKVIFPQIPLLIKSMSEMNILAFLGFILVNAVVIAVFLGISELLYIKSVTELSQETHTNHKAKDNIARYSKKKSELMACMGKDIKMLLRTPVFFTNCVGISFIWPLFVYIAAKLKSVDIAPAAVKAMYYAEDGKFVMYMTIFVVAISIVMTAMNSLGSNAFSREGRHFDFIKYIPVSYETQWNAKALVSIIISTLSIVVYIIIFGIYAAVNPLHLIVYILISIAACTMTTYLGMILDAMRPKLVWDDELSALRENENTFFNMAVSIGIAAVFGAVVFLIMKFAGLNMIVTGLIVIAVLAVIDFILYRHSMTKGISYLMNAEDLS